MEIGQAIALMLLAFIAMVVLGGGISALLGVALTRRLTVEDEVKSDIIVYLFYGGGLLGPYFGPAILLLLFPDVSQVTLRDALLPTDPLTMALLMGGIASYAYVTYIILTRGEGDSVFSRLRTTR